MGTPQRWCGIEFTFLPGTTLMHQTANRKHFVEHGRTHPVHPMTVTPHFSPIKEGTLRYKADTPSHHEPWYSEYCGMAKWLLTTGPDITPGSTLVFRGLGHVTSDHDAAAAELCRLNPRAPASRHHVRPPHTTVRPAQAPEAPGRRAWAQPQDRKILAANPYH